jgi:predicted ATPase/class 3 adenylate cyclase
LDASNSQAEPIESLTRRELEILVLLEEGLTSREIAARLILANNSVRWHIQQIYSKLGVSGKQVAVQRGRELGLLASRKMQKTEPAAHASAATLAVPLPVGTVTFLFTDIEGSTPFWEQHPDQMAVALQIHNAALRRAIEANGGVVFKIVGDSFQAAFATAPQALKAVIAGQKALQSASWNELGPLKVRMGLHTGEAELDPNGDEYAVSHTKNRVARIMSAAHGGQILLSQETADLVKRRLPEGVTLKDLGEHHLKGMEWLERLYQVDTPGLPHEFPPLVSAITPPTNLSSQRTSFIGRHAEINQIKSLLAEHSLVTLTGSGGVGKTRISIQLGWDLLDEYPDGVWLVELAPVSDPAQVPKTVANVFNLREDPGRPILEILVDFLRSKAALILLDNCEHLLLAAVELSDRLLKKCSKLKLLASSREALGVAGEIAFRVPSLTYPDPHQLFLVKQSADYPAVSLFIERAKNVMPGFMLTEKNAPAIARICQRLDGIPLAIELAAARLNLLTTEQLASRLDNAFRLLTGGSRSALPRHQTLRATIDWSYDLLSDQERTLLRRLSVFARSCSLEAAEVVCAGEGISSDEILELLTGLAKKSILQAERRQGEETRYRLLETVRQYAREKLFDARESASLRDRHLDYYFSIAEQAEPQLRSAGRLEWSRRLRLEMDNLRSAIEWAYQQENTAQKGLRLVTAIGFRFLMPEGYLSDAIQWVRQGLDWLEERRSENILVARAYNLLAEVYENQRNYPAVMECVQNSLPCLRELGAVAYPDLIWALWNYGIVSDHHFRNRQQAIGAVEESILISRQMGAAGDWYLGMGLFIRSMFTFRESLDRVRQLAQESRHAFIRSGDRWSVMMPIIQLGSIAQNRGEFSEALENYHEALILAEEIGDRPSVSYAHIHLGHTYRKMGQFKTAIHHHAEYVRLWATMCDQQALKEGLVNLGVDWISLGNQQTGAQQKESYQYAIRLISNAEKQRTVEYTFLYEPQLLDQAVTDCKQAWGETEFQRVWEEGEAMTLDEVIRHAQKIPTS